MKPETQRFVAEMIGTFALVFIGAGAVLANSFSGGMVGLLGIALAHGLVLMAMVYSLGNVSGAHFNPAVTLAFVFAEKMKLKTGLGYILFQLIGSVLAAVALLAVFPSTAIYEGLGAPALAAGVGFSAGTLFEIMLTFFLVFTVFAVALDKKNTTPFIGFAIGMALAIGIIVGGAFTGGALNPARAFGPAMVSEFLQTGLLNPSEGFWVEQAVYWVGPIVGGLAAALVYLNVFLPEEKKRRQKK